MLHIGIVAGLCTACSWAVSSTVHSSISRSVGVHPFMMMRQPLAVAVVAVFCLFAGQFHEYSLHAVSMALVSGLLGIAICDWCLYESVLHIGIRPALVCHSLYVCCTALLGVFFLDEHLGAQGMLGIGMATSGVMMVILAEGRRASSTNHDKPDPARQRVGVGLALLSAVAVAFSFIGTKAAMQDGMPPLMVSFVRNVIGCVAVWAVALAMGRVRDALKIVRSHPRIATLLIIGCAFGPAGGSWLSCVALENAPAAVASTLIGLQPVALLVVSGIAEKRCPCVGSVIGSCTACAGAAVLLLR